MSLLISPCRAASVAEIACWSVSEDEAQAWGGVRTEFPVTPEHMRQWQEDPDVTAWIGRRAGELVAYGEIWCDVDE